MVCLYTEFSDKELTYNTMTDNARKEGIGQRIKQEITQGITKGRLEIATNLFKIDFSREDISKATGLSFGKMDFLGEKL